MIMTCKFRYTKFLFLERTGYSHYRLGRVNSNTVSSKFHSIRIFFEASVNSFFIISCLKCTVNSYFHLIRSKTLPTNHFKLTVPDLYSNFVLKLENFRSISTLIRVSHQWKLASPILGQSGTVDNHS